MTEAELMLYRLQLRIQVRDFAVQTLVRSLQSLPGGHQSLAEWANRVRSSAKEQTVPGVHAAMSDLGAAEYQEAIRELFDGLGL